VRVVGGKVTTIYSGRLSIRTELSVQAGDWMPDGKRIAFLGNKGSRTGIYTIGVDGKGQRKVRVFPDRPITAGGPTMGNLRVSPDGRRFAFVRGTANNTLYVMNANGSGLRKITSQCYTILQDWSPDSKRLLVFWGDKDAQSRCITDGGLYTVSADGGAARRVFTEKHVRTGPGEGYGNYPPLGTFSPDGTRIAFFVQRLPKGSGLWDTLMVMRANGAEVRTVLQGEARLNQNGDCTRCISYGSLAWRRVAR
jgi:Tol biopolymer transport system component